MTEPQTVPSKEIETRGEALLLPGERLDEINEELSLILKTDGLTFGTDAYLLSAFIKPSPRARAVELGAGTGVISLLLATKGKLKSAVAVELQPDYAELCERNVRLNRLEDRITTLRADVRTLSAHSIGYECELVYTNPPYMRTDTGRPNECSRKNIARHETAGGIRDFCLAAARLLKHGGIFACVYRPDRLIDLTVALREAKLEPKRMTFVSADKKTAPSMVLVEARKGGAEGLTVTPPLLLYRESDGTGVRTPSDEARKVYDTCTLYPTQQNKRTRSISAPEKE